MIRKSAFISLCVLVAFLLMVACIAPTASAVVLMEEPAWCEALDAPTRIVHDPATHWIYVSSPREGKIGVFDATGALIDNITSLPHPTSMALDGAGHLYVVSGAAVVRLSLAGAILDTIGAAPAQLHQPHDVAIAPDGSIVVADDCDSIKIFDTGGSYLRGFGGNGYPVGRLDDPVSLTIRGDEIFVSDQNNARINVYSISGAYLRTWGTRGNGVYDAGMFMRPWGTAIDAQGLFWMFDDILNAFECFDLNGAARGVFPVSDSRMRTCVDFTLDGERLYLTDQSAQCVFVYHITDTSGFDPPPDPLREIQPVLTIQSVPEGISLQWTASLCAAEYRVLRSASVGFPAGETDTIAVTTDTFFVDASALSAWPMRFYQVMAVPDTLDPSCRYLNDWQQHETSTVHNGPHTVAEGVDCDRCHMTNFAYPNPVPEWWLADRLCKSCHVETGKARAEQNHFAGTDTMYCVTCHNPHGQQRVYPHNYIRDAIQIPSGAWRGVAFRSENDFVHGAPNYNGICEVCHTQTAHHRNNAGGDHDHFAGTACTDCHSHLTGFAPAGGACNSCHGAPPQTAAHRTHMGIPDAGVGYGDLRQTSDFSGDTTVYNFGCGNCHPGDIAMHRNGTVDIRLFDASAPAGTLKSKNPPTAAYTPGSTALTDEHGITYTEGTCSNIYCHSSGQAEAYRTYQTADWGRETPYGCGDCHGEPPSYPSGAAGAANANSHYMPGQYWGEDVGHVLGIHWGHSATTVANQTATVINCNICHYSTVTSDRNTGQSSGQAACNACHNETTIPPFNNRGVIANAAMHVSGSADIAFSPLPFRSKYRGASSAAAHGWVDHTTYAETVLSNSTYNAQTKTCNNVECHLDQTAVTWGYWGTGWDAGCECHDMTFTLTSVPAHRGLRSLDSQSCRQCHDMTRHAQ